MVTGCLPVPPLARQGSLNALKSVKEQNPQGPEGQEDADRLSTRGQSRVPCWGAKGRPQIFPETSSGSGSQEVPLKHSLLSNEHAPWALTGLDERAAALPALGLSGPGTAGGGGPSDAGCPRGGGSEVAIDSLEASGSQGHGQGRASGLPSAVPYLTSQEERNH